MSISIMCDKISINFPVYVAKDKYLIKKLESGDQH